ncbi:hypothetical protein ACS0TY_023110 [Phlomoides rotata]
MDSERSSFTILMFPWLAHGHIFPFLELAKRILKIKNFHIYLCTTPINFSSINAFIHANSLQDSIELVQLQLSINPQLPPHYHTTKNLPSNLVFTLIKAFQTSKSSFADIVARLKPDLVVFDLFQPWAARISSSQGIPAVHFVIVGAATKAFNYHHYTCWDDDFPFPELCLDAHEKKSQDNLMEFLFANVFEQDKDLFFVNYRLSSEFVLAKTSRALEGKYLDYVSSVICKKNLAIGPLVTDTDINEQGNSEILQWLSKKKQNSTVYISFGSEHFLSKEEIEEIARGVELSEANFIWIIRFPVMEKTMSIEEVLPQGFLDRVRNRGLVVSGWAPQTNILGHPSTGAFVSHCGWSSLSESIYYGVPVIGMPMKINMFIDAKMLVDAGACVEVVRGEDGFYMGDEIGKAINEVIVEKSGEEMRCRAKELSEKMRMEEEEVMEETVENLWQLCCNNVRKDVWLVNDDVCVEVVRGGVCRGDEIGKAMNEVIVEKSGER